MKPLATCAATFALVLGTLGVAQAGSTKVVVAGPEQDPIAGRLQKELVAMGFDPVRVDDAAACSRASIAGWIKETHAAGAACSNGSKVTVWVVGRAGVRVADVVTANDADGEGASDVVALRAAEVTRATLELPDGDEAAPPPPPPAPTWRSAPSTPAVDVVQSRPTPKEPPPRTPKVLFGAGVSGVLGADAKDPALDFALEFRVQRYFAIAARVDVPLQSTNISTSHADFKIAPAVFASGLSFPLAGVDSVVVPRVGSGLGVVWLRSEATTNNIDPNTLNVPATFTPSASTNRADIFSPLVYLNAALSVRIAGPFHIAVEGMLGTTTYRMVVRDQGVPVAYFGQPLATLAMRGELAF